MLLDDDREKMIDHFYGVYLSGNGTMHGNKYFDVDTNDYRWSKVQRYTWFVLINFQKNSRRYYLYRK